MELVSHKVKTGELTIEITIHDLSFRMGLPVNEVHQNHIYVNLTATDSLGRRIWTTPVLAEGGKIKAYSSIGEALLDAKSKLTTVVNNLEN